MRVVKKRDFQFYRENWKVSRLTRNEQKHNENNFKTVPYNLIASIYLAYVNSYRAVIKHKWLVYSQVNYRTGLRVSSIVSFRYVALLQVVQRTQQQSFWSPLSLAFVWTNFMPSLVYT